MIMSTGKLIQWNHRIASGCFFSIRLTVAMSLRSLLVQQELDALRHLLFTARQIPVQLAGPAEASMAALIYQVGCRPVLLPPAPPVPAAGIEQDRVGDAVLAHILLH